MKNVVLGLLTLVFILFMASCKQEADAPAPATLAATLDGKEVKALANTNPNIQAAIKANPALGVVVAAENARMSAREGADDCDASADVDRMFGRIVSSYTNFNAPAEGTAKYHKVEGIFDCDLRGKLSSIVWTPFTSKDGGTSTVRWAGGYFLDEKNSTSVEIHSDINPNWVRFDVKRTTVVDGKAFTRLLFEVEFKGLTVKGGTTPVIVTPPTTGTGTGTTAGKLINFDGDKIFINEKLIDAKDRPTAADATVAFNNGQEVLKKAATVAGLNYSFPNGSFGNGLSAWDWYGYYAYLTGAKGALNGTDNSWTKSENNLAVTYKKEAGGFIFYLHVTKASTTYKPLDPAAAAQPGKNFLLLEVLKADTTPVSVGVWPLQ